MTKTGRNTYIIFLLMILLGRLSFAAGQDTLLVLDSLLQQVKVRNPSLRALHRNIDSRAAAVPWLGSLPDPKLSLGILNLPADSYRLNEDPMSQKMIALSQEFPFFGKLSLREKIGTLNYQRGAQDLAQLQLSLREQIKNEYYQLAYITRALQISEENQSLLADFVTIASTRYTVGRGLQQDVLRSEVERLRLEKMILQLQQQKSASRARMNTLLDYPPGRPLGRADFMEMPSCVWTAAEIESLAVLNNPLIARARLSVETGAARRNLAEKEYWPDITMAVTYSQRNNHPNLLSGVISLNIPLYAGRKQSQKVEQETLAYQEAQENYLQTKNEVLRNLKIVQDMISRDTQLIRLYRDEIIPQAELALSSAIAAYKTDRVDFTTLLENQVNLLNHRIDYFQARRDYLQNIAALEKLCATDLISNANKD